MNNLPTNPGSGTMKVLMVLTSHDELGNTGKKTGFWFDELASPYYAFKDAGAQVTLASPKGGQPPLDPMSNEPDYQTDMTHRFEADAAANAQLAATVRLDSVSQADFDTVFLSRRSRPAVGFGRRPQFHSFDREFHCGWQAGRARLPTRRVRCAM